MRERIDQIVAGWQRARELDEQLIPWIAGVGVAAFVAVTALVWVFFQLVYGLIVGVAAGLLAATLMFGRRSQRAQLEALEGTPGAAAAVLDSMRGQWFVTPVVRVARSQELVHRAVGRPGVVLVGEGPSRAKVKRLLAKERKKMQRVVSEDVPVHTVVVGNGEDDVPLNKLQVHVTKLSREVDKTEVPKVHRKLKPLDKGNIPVPKGYLGDIGNKLR